MKLSGEVRIRRVVVLGAPAFELTALPSKEKVCYGRIDDTFVTIARLFADREPILNEHGFPLHKEKVPKATRHSPKNTIGISSKVLEAVRTSPNGVTAAYIHSHANLGVIVKAIRNALAGLRKRGLVRSEGKRPVVWFAIAQ